MDEQQLQQQIIALVEAAMNGDQQAQQQIEQVMQAAQQGDPQAQQIAQMIQAVAQQMAQAQGGQEQMMAQPGQVSMARLGAKLNYIRFLRGQCPDGYEMQMFKKGGRVCKQCVKKKQAKMQQGGETPTDVIGAFRCGRKMKKKAQGGNVEMDKCGKKMKKACGGASFKLK